MKYVTILEKINLWDVLEEHTVPFKLLVNYTLLLRLVLKVTLLWKYSYLINFIFCPSETF